MQGKSIDQVTDMMVANAQNLIVTIKPANQRNTLHNKLNSRQQLQYFQHNKFSGDESKHVTNDLQKGSGSELNVLHGSCLSHQLPENGSFDSDEDEIIDHMKWSGNASHYR